MADKLEGLEDTLEKFIENVRKLSVVAGDFQPQGQTVLNSTINNIIGGLQEIDSVKSSFSDVNIPFEVFEYIDSGKNPQLYTKDCIEKSLYKNEAVKGKIELYKKFRLELISQIETIFPEEIAKYKRIRGEY